MSEDLNDLEALAALSTALNQEVNQINQSKREGGEQNQENYMPPVNPQDMIRKAAAKKGIGSEPQPQIDSPFSKAEVQPLTNEQALTDGFESEFGPIRLPQAAPPQAQAPTQPPTLVQPQQPAQPGSPMIFPPDMQAIILRKLISIETMLQGMVSTKRKTAKKVATQKPTG